MCYTDCSKIWGHKNDDKFPENFLFKSVQLALLTSLLIVVASCGKKQEINLSVIEDIPTVQTFKEDAIPQADIEKIVKAGMNAQNAMNGQPWHFSVVTNKDLLNGISEKMKEGMAKMLASKTASGDGEKKVPLPSF